MNKLNLGSGNDYRLSDSDKRYINLDNSENVKTDIVCDVTKEKLPFPDNHFDEIIAIDFFEHILYPIPVLNECYRVIKKDGILEIEVPKGMSDDYLKDPTHVRPFIAETFDYFTNETICTHYGVSKWNLQYLRETDKRLFVKLRK